ncbi:hypothetical protein ACH4A8_01415 [Streptomyces vietnamensis]|uniref:hypothetical protein n=1 Tax=Streptomyces vietnamensis TaxID=362257 RepID=UPI0037ACF7BF
MTVATPFPDPSNKDALRQWMRDNRRDEAGRRKPETPEEFTALQRSRLIGATSPEGDVPGRRRLDVALTGPATAQHTVRVSTLGAFLSNLQESVSAVAQALAGRPTSAASIPRSIRDATALSAVATFPSSFGVAMYGPPVENQEDALFPEHVGEVRTVLDGAVDTVLDVVDLSESLGQSDELLAERLVPLGQRALKHLGALTAGLGEANVGLRVAWYAREGRTRRSEWSPGGVQRVRYLCEHSEFAEAEVATLVGWLGAASAFQGKVEIRTDAGEIIRASTEESLTSHLDQYFNKRVQAEVEVTRVRASGRPDRKIYSVLSLRSV